MKESAADIKKHDKACDDITFIFYVAHSVKQRLQFIPRHLIITHSNSCHFHADVEHLTICLCICVITAKDFVAASKARVWHVLETIFLTRLACCQANESTWNGNFKKIIQMLSKSSWGEDWHCKLLFVFQLMWFGFVCHCWFGETLKLGVTNMSSLQIFLYEDSELFFCYCGKIKVFKVFSSYGHKFNSSEI